MVPDCVAQREYQVYIQGSTVTWTGYWTQSTHRHISRYFIYEYVMYLLDEKIKLIIGREPILLLLLQISNVITYGLINIKSPENTRC